MCPTFIRHHVVLLRWIEKLGLRLRPGHFVEATTPESDERFYQDWTTYWKILKEN